MLSRKMTYSVWLRFAPSEIEGQWTVHCLTFDLVSQGHSVEHAFHMIQEAIGLTLVCDLAEGRDPLERQAPDKEWKAMESIRAKGRPCTFAEAKKSTRGFVMTFTFGVELKVTKAEPKKAPKMNPRPALAQAYC